MIDSYSRRKMLSPLSIWPKFSWYLFGVVISHFMYVRWLTRRWNSIQGFHDPWAEKHWCLRRPSTTRCLVPIRFQTPARRSLFYLLEGRVAQWRFTEAHPPAHGGPAGVTAYGCHATIPLNGWLVSRANIVPGKKVIGLLTDKQTSAVGECCKESG